MSGRRSLRNIRQGAQRSRKPDFRTICRCFRVQKLEQLGHPLPLPRYSAESTKSTSSSDRRVESTLSDLDAYSLYTSLPSWFYRHASKTVISSLLCARISNSFESVPETDGITPEEGLDWISILKCRRNLSTISYSFAGKRCVS